MISVDYAKQSDPCLNRQFRRRWTEPASAVGMGAALAALPAPERHDGEPACLATLLRWRDDWRRARAVEASPSAPEVAP